MQKVNTQQGESLFLLTEAEYHSMMEDAGDIALAQAQPNSPTLPLELVTGILSGNLHPLTAWRKAQGMSISALAEKAGVRAATISNIETGKIDPRFSTLKAIAATLDVTVDDVMP